MRRTLDALTALAMTTLATIALAAPTASAAPLPDTASGWEPAPSAPWDAAAGARCDFAVHGEPIVDEVVRRVLSRHSGGAPKEVAYKGDLVVRVTNTATGAAYDADVSGSALVEYGTDGSQFWAVLGPVLVGVAEHGGNLPRSLYVVDGAYTMDISPNGYKTLTLAHGSRTDICDELD
ncbi:hypothetical protein [Streptomyces sp. TE33382]